MALQQGGIDLEDAIDIRRIKNLKLANDVLKQKRKKKQKAEQANQQAMIKTQANANAEASERAAAAEMQKTQALAQTDIQIEQAKNQMEIQRLNTAFQLKQQEMQLKHQFDMELKGLEVDAMKQKEALIEDRKDKRTKIDGSQQSKLIDQRNNDLMPINFESKSS